MGQKATLQLVTTAKAMPSHFLATVDFADLMAGMSFCNNFVYDSVPENLPTIACPGWWDQTGFLRQRDVHEE